MTEKDLISIKRLRAIANRYKLLADESFTKLNQVTKDFNNTKVSIVGKQTDKADLFDKHMTLKDKYTHALKEYEDTRLNVLAIIDLIDDPLLSDLLYLKYIDENRYTWQALASMLHISERYVYTAHDKAIKEFRACCEFPTIREKAEILKSVLP